MWRSLMPGKQHGQIRGYQVHYVRVENGESRGLPLIKDVMLADAQVWSCHCFLSTIKLCHTNVNSATEQSSAVCVQKKLLIFSKDT